jgi:hypothetical protein
MSRTITTTGTVGIALTNPEDNQDGPLHRFDTTRFPPERYRMVDCSDDHDFADDFQNSHQYYRRSPTVRADIAAVMAV